MIGSKMSQAVTLTFLLAMSSAIPMFFIKPTSVYLSFYMSLPQRGLPCFLQSLFGFPGLNLVLFITLPYDIQEFTCITTHNWAFSLRSPFYMTTKKKQLRQLTSSYSFPCAFKNIEGKWGFVCLCRKWLWCSWLS